MRETSSTRLVDQLERWQADVCQFFNTSKIPNFYSRRMHKLRQFWQKKEENIVCFMFSILNALSVFHVWLHDGKARKRAKNKNLVPKDQKSANNSQKGPKVAFVGNRANNPWKLPNRADIQLCIRTICKSKKSVARFHLVGNILYYTIT